MGLKRMVVSILLVVVLLSLGSAQISNDLRCTLSPVNPNVRDDIDRLLASGIKMIEFDLKIKDSYHEVLERKGGDNFRWNHWVRTASIQARSLLMLDENYELLSLSSMTIGIEKMEVILEDSPTGCISSLFGNDTTSLIRETLLYDFEPINISHPAPHHGADEHVCNMYCRDDDGSALFVYHCCHYDQHGQQVCLDVTRGGWMNILFIFTMTIKVSILLFSPLMIPERFYRKKFTAAEYYYRPSADNKKVLRVVATRSPENYKSSNKVIKRDKISGMDSFKRVLSTMGVDKIYELEMDDFRLSVNSHRLIRENAVPVGVLRYMYNNFCRCKIRFTETLKPCCYTSVCGKFDPGFKLIPWHKCLMTLMKICQTILVALPWLFRVYVYNSFEAKELENKRTMANSMGLKMSFQGSFTILLSPFHGVFLFCYVILVLDFLFYGVLSKMVQDKIIMVLRDCLRDMTEKSKLNVCGWGLNLSLAPFKAYGIVGTLIAVPFWIILSPLLIVVYIFYFVPTININMRLVMSLIKFLCPKSLFTKFRIMKSETINSKLKLNKLSEGGTFRDKDDFSVKGLLLQLFAISITIISFWSLTFLLMECISFFVEVGVYTLMGIIINAGVTVRYISVLFLLGFYVRDCFGNLYKKYLNFHKVIVDYILSKNKAEIVSTARADAQNQDNTVFRIKSQQINTTDDIKLIVKDHEIKWQTSGFVVFLDQQDTPYFTKKFFFEAIEMKYHGCPGPLYRSIYRTFLEFFKIIVFLLLFIIVIMAFSDVYSISSTNQMLATVAGGLMPIIVRHVFTNKGNLPSFDTESVQFQAEFDATLRRFKQSWPVYDIVPSTFYIVTDPPREEVLDANDMSTGRVNDNDSVHIVMPSSQDMAEDEHEADLIVDVASARSSSSQGMAEDEHEADLIVDVSSARVKTKANNGSLSMLAEPFRAPEDQDMMNSHF